MPWSLLTSMTAAYYPGPQDKKSKADFVFLCGCKENSEKPCLEVFPLEELMNAFMLLNVHRGEMAY